MKKIIISVAAVLVAAASQAQTMYDGITFGRDNYYGTARTLAMGNAVTAVGADLGSVNINPAGPAVAGYSQFTLTPAVSITAGSSTYKTSMGSENEKFSKARFEMPNFGVTLRFDTGNRSGLRSFTFGFVANMTGNYLNEDYASGHDNLTSMAGSYATIANRTNMPGDIYSRSDKYSSVNSGLYGWNTIMAYDNKLINYCPTKPVGEHYYGSNEVAMGGGYGIPGTLAQSTGSATSGVKRDLTFNFGLNFDNFLYIGVNLVLPSIRYNYAEEYTEAATNKADFPIAPEDPEGKAARTYFKSARYSYNYSTTMAGIYGKIGVIWLPTDNVRLGFAIKTPTGYNISESYQSNIETRFDDSRQDVAGNPSPRGEYSYRFNSPFEFNVGAAVTLGGFALLSADYEMTCYNTMRFIDPRNRISPLHRESTFYQVNKVNTLFAGLAHNLRVGAEANILPCLAVRLGFNLETSPERYYDSLDGGRVTANDYMANFDNFETGVYKIGNVHKLNENVLSYSAGLGYISNGAFFADLAVRLARYPEKVFTPYPDYMPGVLSPTVELSKRNLWDIVMTFGFRF